MLLACAGALNAQRYLDQVFSQASKTTRIYGSNFTALTLPVTGHTMRQPLVMNVYEPTGDTEAERPLIIYLHTGNLLPYPQNGACGGTINDSATVEIATRLAKMGYVVAVADYRLGWNPLANDPTTGELTRRSTLINAAYRGVQDIRTCIRYFKRNFAIGANEFRVDTSKIVVWGQGTGGYLSLAAASLDAYSEIITTSIPHKFEIPAPPPTNWIPMVLEAYNGNIYGTSGPGISDAFFNQITGGAFPIGDTLAVSNHPGYSSDFHLAVNMGGALGDSLWIEDGGMPIISFHNPNDPLAPCGTDIFIVPTTGDPVLEVSGSCDVQSIQKKFGNNNIFNGIPDNVDPYGNVADSRNGGRNGLFLLPAAPDASLWDWFAAPMSPAGGTCNTNSSIARAYIDTIVGYFAPRACLALGLGCGFTDTKELTQFEAGVSVAPVPATDAINFSAKEMIRHINIYDMNGRLVKSQMSVNAENFTMQRGTLQNGLYIAEIRFEQGFVKRKIVFSN